MLRYHWPAIPVESIKTEPKDKWGTCVGFAAADAVKATIRGFLSQHF